MDERGSVERMGGPAARAMQSRGKIGIGCKFLLLFANCYLVGIIF